MASAGDAVDALPDGLDGRLEERGRSLSGGQRQRLALARALLRDAETLVLVEPTSAVDAHTEARIGQRLRDARAGRSTVVMTSSPLMLDHADRVVFLAGGRVRATGTHDGAAGQRRPAYRSVVLRGEEDGDAHPAPAPPGPGGRLPVATSAEVREPRPRRLFRQHRRPMTLVLAPARARRARRPGRRRRSSAGWSRSSATHPLTVSDANRFALILAAAVIVQSVLTRYARYTSFVLGERVFAQLREEFVDRVLGAAAVDGRAGRHRRPDLAHHQRHRRAVGDRAVRGAVGAGGQRHDGADRRRDASAPGRLVALPVFVGVPILWVSTRWYLRRAPDGYLAERAAYAELNGTITETVDGRADRRRAGPAARGGSSGRGTSCARRTASSGTRCGCARSGSRRSTWRSCCRCRCACCGAASWSSTGGPNVAAVTAVTLYVVQLVDPLDELLSWLDEVQVGASSLARIIGVAKVPPTGQPAARSRSTSGSRRTDASYAYREGHDVLHGVSLTWRPGERLAVVGPSGAGKSTLGRLLAGIHPPRTGSVTVGGVPLVDLPLEELRGSGGAGDPGAPRVRRDARREPAAGAAGCDDAAAGRRPGLGRRAGVGVGSARTGWRRWSVPGSWR